MKIKVIKNVIANIDGRSVSLSQGQEIDVNDNDAIHIVRGGYAEFAESSVKVMQTPASVRSGAKIAAKDK